MAARMVGSLSTQATDLHDLDALFVQPRDLLVPFLKLSRRLIFGAFFFHLDLSTKAGQNLNFMRLYQKYDFANYPYQFPRLCHYSPTAPRAV